MISAYDTKFWIQHLSNTVYILLVRDPVIVPWITDRLKLLAKFVIVGYSARASYFRMKSLNVSARLSIVCFLCCFLVLVGKMRLKITVSGW